MRCRAVRGESGGTLGRLQLNALRRRGGWAAHNERVVKLLLGVLGLGVGDLGLVSPEHRPPTHDEPLSEGLHLVCDFEIFRSCLVCFRLKPD